MEIENAATAHTPKLLAATTAVIDRLLGSLTPALFANKGYRGDTSDTITGYQGVQVFLFNDGRVKLQVNGPDTLLTALAALYRVRLTLHERSKECVVFLALA